MYCALSETREVNGTVQSVCGERNSRWNSMTARGVVEPALGVSDYGRVSFFDCF